LGEARKVFAASEALARSVWDAAAREVAGVVVPPLQSDLVRTPTHPAREAFVCHVRESSPQVAALLEAMSRSTAACRFDIIVEGRADGVADLVAQVAGRGHLGERVQVVGGASRQRQADLIAEARALVYTPGGGVAGDWPILAAFHARTPVVVLQGAGAPLDLVRHGQNGLVVEPRSQPLAEVLDTLWRDEAQAAHLGEAGYETLETRGLSWEAAAAALLA
jgi:glycosyltransferase involved in cell wall biosynthesis